MVLFGLALCWIFALIGLFVPNGEAAQAASFPLLAPLVFASSAFVDPRTMPGPLRWWAERQPVSITAKAVRSLTIGGPDFPSAYVWGSIAWSLAIIAVMAPLAIRRYLRS